jgi:hypothetical protein
VLEATLSDFGEIPQLMIVPVEKLKLHEHHDEQRNAVLIKNFISTGVLRNPPIVLPLRKQNDGYMVLDGANRVFAFQRMGIPHILVQIVHPDDPNLDLNSWNHVLWGIHPDKFINRLRKIPGIMLQPRTPALSFQDLMDIHAVASIHLADGSVFTAFTSSMALLSRVTALNLVINQYVETVQCDRTTVFQINCLQQLYDDLCGLVVLPTFQLIDLMNVVEAGQRMPPGVTRFTISPRVLHVNYALNILKTDDSIESKNTALQKWITSKLTEKSVRYYAEPTITFNE